MRSESAIVIYMQAPPYLCSGVHVHSCPECYERKACVESCSREPDQEGDDGMQAGCVATCDDCLRAGAERWP